MGGEVKDGVAACGYGRDVPDIADIAFGDPQAGVIRSVSEIGSVPGAEVVQDHNLPASVEEPVNEVATYEAQASGYQTSFLAGSAV
jgi:hypothetical protein